MGTRLAGKVAIITGGSRGQGAATAKLFSSEGAQIMLADVNVPDPSLMDFLDGSAHFMRLDVSDAAGWRDVVAATQKTFGQVNVLINNAGVYRPSGLAECLCVIRKHPHVYADLSTLCMRPWQFYNVMLLAQEYKVLHKILYGTDYPFCKSQEHINGVRNVNKVIATSGLPRVSDQAITDMLNRDACALLGLK